LKADGANLTALAPFTISPSNTLRLDAWGSAPSPSPATAAANTEIIALNNSVLGLLPNGDVRKNYMLTGATWTPFGAPPTAGNHVGTNKMANTTMETYQQGGNCFDCHRSNQPSLKPEALSHVFGPLQPLFGGPPLTTVYTSTIQPIWDAKCIGCHNGGASAPKGLDLTAGNSYGLLFNVNATEVPSLKRIKANDPANSYLVRKVEGTQGAGNGSQMPFGCSGTDCLTASQIIDIKAWINAGAKP
jgi:mono/diheme cytochrome c family protein